MGQSINFYYFWFLKNYFLEIIRYTITFSTVDIKISSSVLHLFFNFFCLNSIIISEKWNDNGINHRNMDTNEL